MTRRPPRDPGVDLALGLRAALSDEEIIRGVRKMLSDGALSASTKRQVARLLERYQLDDGKKSR